MIGLRQTGLLAFALMSGAVQAGEPVSPCAAGLPVVGEVATVIDGRSFVLTDGREVRLTSIEVPSGEAGRGARDVLTRLVVGTSVGLSAAADQPDRYGRLPVRSALPAGARPVEEILLAEGEARVAAIVADPGCRAALLALEQAARGAGRGRWRDKNYQIKQADDADALAPERGRFAIVEGRVVSVRESGGTVYINFGRRWSRDFSVTISKRNQRMFASAGVEPKRLEGRRLRVRGYIEMRGGPWIEATHPAQIEVIGSR